MITTSKIVRNGMCILSFIENETGIGSIEISELNHALVSYLEKAIVDFNRSQQEPEAATITGKTNPT
jgi:hypothetical protein